MSTRKGKTEGAATGNATDAEELTFETIRLPNVRNQRAYLASIAEDLTYEDLKTQAPEVGVDLSGASSREAALEMFREAVRSSPVTATSNEG